MNKKAEIFQKYLKDGHENEFFVDDIKDAHNTVAFRTNITIKGKQLPAFVFTDDSDFVVLGAQIAGHALNAENEQALLKLVNEENAKYKPFKLFFDENGSLIVHACLIMTEAEFKVNKIYSMFDLVDRFLNDSYDNLMDALK